MVDVVGPEPVLEAVVLMDGVEGSIVEVMLLTGSEVTSKGEREVMLVSGRGVEGVMGTDIVEAMVISESVV